jgi:hypothetical protein
VRLSFAQTSSRRRAATLSAVGERVNFSAARIPLFPSPFAERGGRESGRGEVLLGKKKPPPSAWERGGMLKARD